MVHFIYFIYLFIYDGTSAFLASESMLYERALESLNPLSPILSSISIDTLSPFAKLCGASPTRSGFPALVPSLLPIWSGTVHPLGSAAGLVENASFPNFHHAIGESDVKSAGRPLL